MNSFPTNQITRGSSRRVLLFLSSTSMSILCLLHNSCLYSGMNITTGIHAFEGNLFPISAPQIPTQLHGLGEAAWQTSRTAPSPGQGSQKQLWAAGGVGHNSAPAPDADERKHPLPRANAGQALALQEHQGTVRPGFLHFLQPVRVHLTSCAGTQDATQLAAC